MHGYSAIGHSCAIPCLSETNHIIDECFISDVWRQTNHLHKRGKSLLLSTAWFFTGSAYFDKNYDEVSRYIDIFCVSLYSLSVVK
jgi:hypothetical protein